jgi:hypothetical protein
MLDLQVTVGDTGRHGHTGRRAGPGRCSPAGRMLLSPGVDLVRRRAVVAAGSLAAATTGILLASVADGRDRVRSPVSWTLWVLGLVLVVGQAPVAAWILSTAREARRLGGRGAVTAASAAAVVLLVLAVATAAGVALVGLLLLSEGARS